jgi:hypothetical protein
MLQERKLLFQQQSPVRVMFHGVELGDFFADLLVES